MKLANIFVILLLAAGLENTCTAQIKVNKHIITGYVTDAHHYPVGGAIILVNGSESGIITDEKGFYKVRITSEAASVGVFSLKLGIIEEFINGRTRINFAFSGSERNMDISPEPNEIPKENEEINIGYATRERRNITTDISKIDNSDKRFSNYNSVYDMLQGTVPGVMVNKDRVLIRGISSIRQSTEPLYIVDGIPVNSLGDIPPYMVKSIEVLKGAAGAIYGSRGANGVIIVDLVGAPETGFKPLAIPGRAPFASTQTATSISATTATLNGIVNANYLSAFISFEYGMTPGYGSKIQALQSPVTGNTSLKVSSVVTNLKPGVTYHFRVVATNLLGSTVGLDIPFTTLGEVPSVQTGNTTNASPETAILNGTVNAHHLPTDVSFEYGITPGYGSSVKALRSPLTDDGPVQVSATVTGLKAGTTYHYRIVANNEKGSVYGEDATFSAEYKIGEFINGGYIFYIDETGEHGLVSAPSDQSEVALWGGCTPPGAAGKAVGTGNKNTSDILNGCPAEGTAARLCSDLELNGYSDWFLPSVSELSLMFNNLHEKGLGSFSESFYWSSTQDKFGAWVVSFYYGSKSNHSREESSIRTRAVRAF